MATPRWFFRIRLSMKDNMHESITEHINQDKGYNDGYQAGVKRAWDLLGELAQYYKRGVEAGHLMDEEDAGKASGRYEAALYAQMVIKRDTV